MSKRQVSKPKPGATARRDLALLDTLGEIERHANDVRESNRLLDAAVLRARSLGGSWSRIARAPDMTPQGSHKRWRETVPKSAGKAPEAAPQGTEDR